VKELGDQATSSIATYMRLHFMVNNSVLKYSATGFLYTSTLKQFYTLMFRFHNLVSITSFYFTNLLQHHFTTWVLSITKHTSSIPLEYFISVLPTLHTASRLLSAYVLTLHKTIVLTYNAIVFTIL
jgi:hypothetical protein